ncbi:MAG: DUF4411 family protein [Mobilitalea sp.]
MNEQKYVFDSNIFINLQRRHPNDIFGSLWVKLEELIGGGIIISSTEVFDEITVGDDDLVDWAKKKKNAFLPSNEQVQKTVRDILTRYEKLILGGKKTNGADPFVVALAIVYSCIVVTEEIKSGKDNPPKIPNVCEAYGVRYINFVTFLREIGYRDLATVSTA